MTRLENIALILAKHLTENMPRLLEEGHTVIDAICDIPGSSGLQMRLSIGMNLDKDDGKV